MKISDVEKYLIEGISMESIKSIKANGGVNHELIDTLWTILKSNKHPYSWRAAWTLWHFTNDNKEMMRQYIEEIIELLPHFKHDGQKREMQKILMLFDMKELDMGKLLNISFDFLLDPKQSLAVRVHAMQTIFNISEIEPDIKQELKRTLLFLPDSSPGFKGRKNKLLKKMRHIE